LITEILSRAFILSTGKNFVITFQIVTTLEAIYENGIFKPISGVPDSLKENERVRIIIETDSDKDLEVEIAQWESASDEDFLKFEDTFGLIKSNG